MTNKRIFDLDVALPLTGTEIFEAEQDGMPDSVKVTTSQIAQAVRLALSGSGNGFDADLLDGQHGSYYLNASHISAGTLSVARGGTGITSFSPNTFFFASGSNSVSFRTPAQVRSDIQAEPAFAVGTITQYLRGDKSWQNLDKGAIGLSNVDNTSDLAKPVSTATQDALNQKAALNHTHTTTDITNLSSYTGFDLRYFTKAEQNSLFAPIVHNHTISQVTGLQLALDGKLSIADRDVANGVAGLDNNGKINPLQLPALAITDTFVVASEAAMLALSAETGDLAVRTDIGRTFVLAATPASALGNWQEILAPTGAVASIFGRTGVVTAQTGDYSFAQIGSKPTTLGGYGITDATPSSHIGSGDGAHAVATTSVAGFMSAADKSKLDGIASGAVADHGGLSGLNDDDHPQYYNATRLSAYTGFDSRYYTEAETDSLLGGKENVGVAASLISVHEQTADPHPQYLTQTEGDTRYRQETENVDWSDLDNIPSTFAPSAHTHVSADITDLVDTIDSEIVLRGFSSTGLISGGHISINALDNSKFDVSQARARFTDYSNPALPSSIELTTGPFTGLTVNNIATSVATYVGIASDGSIVQQSTKWTNTQRRDIVSLGVLVHSNNTIINVTNDLSATILAPVNQLHDFMEAIGQLNIQGNDYFANGANLQLDRTAGSLFKLGSNFTVNPEDPHVVHTNPEVALTFRYRLRNSTEYSNRTTIDTANYDNNGVLTSVPNNKYTVQRIYLFQSGLTRIQYGQHVYDSLDDAKAAFPSEAYVTEPNMAQNGFLRAYVIVKNGATSLQNVLDAQIFNLNKFGSATSAGIAITSQAVIDALGYTPASAVHSHAISDITGLQTALDNKQPLDSDLTAIAALPSSAGFLKKVSDGSWILDNGSPAGGVAGSNGEIQFNSSGAFGASPEFKYTRTQTAPQDTSTLNLGVLTVTAENSDTGSLPSTNSATLAVTKAGRTSSFKLFATDATVATDDNTYFEIDLNGIKLEGRGSNSPNDSYLRWNTNTIWHAGNDGASSGLDADLLDGQQGSYYLNWNNFTNIPSTFAPSAHTHTTADITDLSSYTGFDARYYTETEVNATFVPLSQKGAANGVASLGADGKIESGQLPSIAITDTFVVNSQIAMTSLTAQTGDVAVRTDLNKTFILAANDPTIVGNWQEMLTPTDAVSSVFGRTGAVTAQTGDYTFAQIGSKPTTLSGYGITDATPSSHIGSGDGAHALVTETVSGFMSAADKVKLDGIATGATANVGTVTSVGLTTTSTGLTIGSSPVTSSGNITVDLSANLQSWSSIAPSTKADDSTVVHLAGTETITGDKTFTGIQTFSSDTTTHSIRVTSNNDTASTSNALSLVRKRTTGAVLAGDSIGTVRYDAFYDATNSRRVASLEAFASQNHSGSAAGSLLQVSTVADNSTSLAARWQWLSSGNYVPVVNNAYSLGDATRRVSTGFFNAVDIASGGSINNGGVSNTSSATSTVASTSSTVIDQFAITSFRSGKVIVEARDSVTGEVQISELLVAHDGTTAIATEYGVVHTGSAPLVTFEVDISAGNLRLLVSRGTTNSTTYKIHKIMLVA